MSKTQYYSPEELRAPGEIKFKDIPVNQYQKTVTDELKTGNFSSSDMMRIYRDMRFIREFETMFLSISTKGAYNGVHYRYIGPAHLYIGEDAAAVGQSYLLEKDDYIFGNHRSHGEVIAKGLSAIHKMSEETLSKVMESYFGGRLYKTVRKYLPRLSVKKQAITFFLYGLMCELFGRANGFAKGLGNSMHLFFIPFGIYPNNAIVGASPCIATGAGLYKKESKSPGIVIANAGDGSLGCGAVWEALNFASMDQFHTLWPEDYRGGLPIIFNFMDNGYGMGGRTNGETMAYGFLARVGAGINPDEMHAERVDGLSPLAVIDAYKRKIKLLKDGRGPVLLDILTYRLVGHSISDRNGYRSLEEVEAWSKIDCIKLFKDELIDAGVCSNADIDELDKSIKAEITEVLRLAINDDISPRIDLEWDPDGISRYTFNHGKAPQMKDWPLEVLTKKENNPRLKAISKKERFGSNYGGGDLKCERSAVKRENRAPKHGLYNLSDAVFEAILDKFYEDPSLIAYGEDVREFGGVYGVYQGLCDSIPYNRLFNAPISESCIVSSAVGYGMCGGRSIIELMFCDFMGRAGDEIFNQLAKWQAMSAGMLKLPVVLRVCVGRKYGAQHSQDWSAFPAHVPGLKVVFPATPYDAKGLMTAALNGTDPVVFFESQLLYEQGEIFHQGGVPFESYEIPIGEPDIKRKGGDITILTVGATLYRALKAADILSKDYGIEAEIIDARSLVPFNYDKVISSVKKTGRIILASDACARGNFLNDMATHINSLAFSNLVAPPVVLGCRNWITPSPEMEKEYFPDETWFLDAIHEKILPLYGYTPVNDFTAEEEIRRERLGL